MAKKGKGVVRCLLLLRRFLLPWRLDGSIFADEIGRPGGGKRGRGISLPLIGFFGLIGLRPIVSGRKTISVFVGKTQRTFWGFESR